MSKNGRRAAARKAAHVLEFRGVWFEYDSEPAVEDVTLSIDRGEFAAILGPNGSGKTTLVRLALGLERPTRGQVRLFGQSPASFKDWDMVGYVPQRAQGLSNPFPATVGEVVQQGLYRGFDPLAFLRRDGNKIVMDVLEMVGLTDLESRKMSTLSLGQQQRALVARALVRKPELLVLDEPVAGVDAGGQEQLKEMLRRLNRDEGITILMVSHDIGAVMRDATTVACINKSLVFHGPAHDISRDELSALYGLSMDVLVHDALHEHR